ncbi:hypothetical protein B0A49_13950, partial [Cryomyces minteri]
ATQQLDRIVIDECHVVLSRKYTFRKQLQQLGKLMMAETQMVLLTATLPPSEEEELWRRMYYEKEQVKVFRARTARVNVGYRVIDVSGVGRQAEKEGFVLKLIKARFEGCGTGKVVVYCNTVGRVKRFAEELGCDAYHHHAIGKDSILNDFTEGKQRIIVATRALGMGVDIPDIRVIVHVDRPRTLLDYAQESGRAGRDGARSEAIAIVDNGEGGWRDNEQTEKDRRLVEKYMRGKDGSAVCRRIVLDEYLDARRVRVGCEEGEELCDVCGGIVGVEDKEATGEERVEEEVEAEK